jgi:DnaJ-class molecular chaperone
VEVAAEVSLFEVESGTSRTIRYQVEDACGNCRGSGQVRTNDQRMMYCPVCAGTGVQSRNRSVTVQIPAGVEDGQRLRVSKGGSEGGDGRTGDLFVVVAVAPHPQFKRRGTDLEIEIDVDYVVAALGGVVRVPTLTSSGQMNLPAGTPTGRLVRLKGKGLPGKGGTRGDLLARVRVTVPDDLSDEERKLLEQIKALRGGTA